MVKQRHREIATGDRQRQIFKKEISSEGSLEKLAENRPREASADSCFRSLRAVLNYTFMDEDNITSYINPVNTLSSRKNNAWFKVDRRRSIIKNSDLRTWGKAVMALESKTMRDFLLFLLHTGLRRNEAASLKWSQVDFKEGTFTIADTKNGDPHTLPLSDYLHNVLTERKEGLEGKSIYVFPGTGKTGYLQDPKKAIAAVTETTGIVFTCHDLRRTFATLAESLDLSSYTVKALLNHRQQTGDVTGGYIILNVDRLREPMQKITNALQERMKKQYGQIVQMKDIAEQM
jgi:integrase